MTADTTINYNAQTHDGGWIYWHEIAQAVRAGELVPVMDSRDPATRRVLGWVPRDATEAEVVALMRRQRPGFWGVNDPLGAEETVGDIRGIGNVEVWVPVEPEADDGR